MFVSPIKPISVAFSHTNKMLFKPFRFSKWFALGLLVWLSSFIGSDTVWNSFSYPNTSGFSNGYNFSEDDFSLIIEDFAAGHFSEIAPIIDFLTTYKTPVIIASIFILLLILPLSLLFTWLGSRGKFAFMYNVGKNRDEIEKPWKIYAKEANSYMWFSYIYGLLFLVAFCIALYFILLKVFLPMVHTLSMDSFSWDTLMPFISITLGSALFLNVLIFINFLIVDFVLPIMFLRKVKFWKGVQIFVKEGLPHRFWSIILYGILKFFLCLAAGIGIFMFCFLTCCIGFILMLLPVIGAVLLLPVSVFFQAYNFAFIEQFGDGWKLFTDEEENISSGGLLNSAMEIHEDQ